MNQKILNLWKENVAWNEIIYNAKVLKSNLCNINDDYILVGCNIAVIPGSVPQVSSKNFAPFTKYKTEIDGTTKDDAEDIDLVMPMYNLIEYSSNYSNTTGSLWFYSEDEANNFDNNIENTYDFKSFKYKAKLIGGTVA